MDINYFRAIHNSIGVNKSADRQAASVKANIEKNFSKTFGTQECKVNDHTQELIVTHVTGDERMKNIISRPSETFYVGDIVDCYGQKWIVLDVDKTNHKMLLMSTKILKCITWGYAPNYNGCTWNNSYAREWLNNDFYMMAFTPQEREKIVMTYLEDPNYDPVINATLKGSQDTEDRIFLLTLDEVIHKYDFHNDSYFKKNGIFQTPYCIRDEFDTNYADMGLGYNTCIESPFTLSRDNGFNGVDYCASFCLLKIPGDNFYTLSYDNGVI